MNKDIKKTMKDAIESTEPYLKPSLKLKNVIKQINDLCKDTKKDKVKQDE